MPRIVPAASPEAFTSFGDLLKYLRRRAHLTQKDLSIAVGYSEPQISYLETNRRLPDVATVSARFVPELDLADEPMLACRLIKLAEAARHEDDPAPGDPPFKGLQYFDENDADLFFGREELTARLVEQLGHSAETQSSADLKFLAIVGASGSGKSSILRAGLIPVLRRRPGYLKAQLHIITPTAHPLQVLAAHSAADVLAVDQFEELFTLCADEAERTAFVDQLLTMACSSHPGNRMVVIALRADFYSECAHYANLREALAQHQVYIGPMKAVELRRAIEEPAKRGGWEFEPGLIDLLLRDTSEEPGALPLLSHALLETWTRRRGRMLTVSGYLASGGVQGAIAETAETVFNDELDPAQRMIARNIFLRLTELGEGTQAARRRADLRELILRSEDEPLVESVINRLVDARLIITSESTVEIAHEALIREWPLLHQWLIEDRESLVLHRQLAIAAQAWDGNGRPPDELYRGARLARVLEWAALHADESNVLERAFLDAAREQAEREQFERERQIQRELEAAQKLAETESRSAKQLRRRAVFLAGALALAILLAGAALFLGSQANQNALAADTNARTADQQRAAAETNAKQAGAEQQIATARELAAAAVANLAVDPERSILLSRQAINTSLQNNQPVLIEAEDALHRSIQASRVLATLRGHKASVLAVVVSPDGKRLATFSDDETIKIWDTAIDKELLSIPTGLTAINVPRFISFSPDGKRIAAPAGNHLVKVWDVASGQDLLTLAGHTDEVLAIAFSPDSKRIATGSADTTAKLWNAATGQELTTLTGQGNEIATLAFSPDGSRLYTASDSDGLAIAWDPATGKQVFTFDNEGGVQSLAVSPDGTRLATGEFDTTVKIWDAATGSKLLTLFGHASYIDTVVYSLDGKRLASTSEDGTTRIWDAETGKALLTLSGHASGVLSAAFSPDSNRLYTSSRDATIKVWDVSPTAGSDWLNLAGHTNKVNGVAYRPDGKQLATLSYDGSVKIWDAVSGKEMLTIALPGIGSSGNGVLGGLSYSPDGQRLAFTDAFTTTIIDATSGTESLTLPTFKSETMDVVFSHDGTQLAVGSQDGTVGIYDSSTGKMIIQFPTSSGGIQRIAFSPDGKRLASANGDGAYVWDAATGQKLLAFSGHGEGVRSSGIAFSPDGKWIATSGNDATIKVWDSETGAEIFTLIGHTGPTFSTAFSADGQYLASSSVDRTVKVWKLPKVGEQVPEPLTLYGNSGAVYQVAFSPDGTRVVSAGRDPVVRMYDLNINDLLNVARSRLTRTLTQDECAKYLHVAPCPVAP